MHTYHIGGHEVVIRPPSGDSFDRYIDSQLSKRPQSQQALMLDCVASPDPATLQAWFATKPAWKSKIVAACEALAGDILKASVITDAEQPGCKALTIGEHPFVFRPADADQYDAWESRIKAMTSHATLDLTRACLVSPSLEEFAELDARLPAIKYTLARVIATEAGLTEELLEKK